MYDVLMYHKKTNMILTFNKTTDRCRVNMLEYVQ